jgi:hypothetical protein
VVGGGRLVQLLQVRVLGWKLKETFCLAPKYDLRFAEPILESPVLKKLPIFVSMAGSPSPFRFLMESLAILSESIALYALSPAVLILEFLLRLLPPTEPLEISRGS